MKLKTKSAAVKRFKVSAKGSVSHRSPHQAHFNARDTGKDSRRKHGDVTLSPSDNGRIEQLLPYAKS